MSLVIIILFAIATISEMSCPDFDETEFVIDKEKKHEPFIDEHGNFRLKKYDDKAYKVRMKRIADLKKAQKIHESVSFIASSLLLIILVWCNKGSIIEFLMELAECFQ